MTQMYCLWNPQAPYRHGNCCSDWGEATPLKYGQMYLMRCLDWGRDHWGELQLNRWAGSLYYFLWFVAVVNPENHCRRDAKLLNVFLFFGLYTLFIYYLRVRERERTKREHYGFGNDLILVCADNSFCRQASEPLFPLVFITAQELILIKRSASLRLMSLIKSTSNVC